MDPRDEKLLNTFQLLLIIVLLMVMIVKGCGVENTCKPIGCVEETVHRSIKQQNSLNNRAFTYANSSAIQAAYGAECIYCHEVFVNKKKQSGYICNDCVSRTFR